MLETGLIYLGKWKQLLLYISVILMRGEVQLMLDALYESISKLKLKFDTPILRREPSLMYDTQLILVIISHFVYDLFFFRVLYQRKENLPTQCATLSTTAHCRSFSSHCFCISSLHTSGRLSVSDQLKRGQL